MHKSRISNRSATHCLYLYSKGYLKSVQLTEDEYNQLYMYPDKAIAQALLNEIDETEENIP